MSVAGLAGTAADFLHNRYASSLRDIRRTYQRAFKALLFVHRFALSARPRHGEGLGAGLYADPGGQVRRLVDLSRSGVTWTTHKANFDFNFLPIGDDYFPPAGDDRVRPARAKRVAALFDWWERIFDYTRMRKEVRAHCDRHVWLLFEEARDVSPPIPRACCVTWARMRVTGLWT